MKELEFNINNQIVLSFDETVKHETYSCEWYYGIIFYVYNDNNYLNEGCSRYDIVHNIYLGNRILIYDSEGCRDIPFKKATFGLLPLCVRAIEL